MIYVIIAIAFLIGYGTGFVVGDDSANGPSRLQNYTIRAAFSGAGLICAYTVCVLIRGLL